MHKVTAHSFGERRLQPIIYGWLPASHQNIRLVRTMYNCGFEWNECNVAGLATENARNGCKGKVMLTNAVMDLIMIISWCLCRIVLMWIQSSKDGDWLLITCLCNCVTLGTHHDGTVEVYMRSVWSCWTKKRNQSKHLPLKPFTLSSGMISSGIRCVQSTKHSLIKSSYEAHNSRPNHYFFFRWPMFSRTMDQEWDTSDLLTEARTHSSGQGGMGFVLPRAVLRSVHQRTFNYPGFAVCFLPLWNCTYFIFDSINGNV